MRKSWGTLFLLGSLVVCLSLIAQEKEVVQTEKDNRSGFDAAIRENAKQMANEGKRTFRFDTFGDEAFWGDTLHLHQAIEGAKLGGVGPGVSPATALAVGLKVDVEALPEEVRRAIRQGKADLNNPATTLALLKLNAVVGVTGIFSENHGSLRSVGIQCA